MASLSKLYDNLKIDSIVKKPCLSKKPTVSLAVDLIAVDLNVERDTSVEAAFHYLSHLRIKCRLLVSSWEGTVSTQLLPEEPFSVVQDVPCMWGDVIAGCASAHLGFEVLWVLAKKSIMGIKTSKAEALSPHIWEQDWWWVCFLACMDYTEGLKPRPIQHDHTDLCPYHTCPPHIAAPIAAV